MNTEVHNTESESAPVSSNEYFVIYCDLLGFSADMTSEGSSYIFDYYGAALTGASQYPSVKVYLLSDTFLAFVNAEEMSLIPDFLAWLANQWGADGLLPQFFIGYGTFIEGRSNFGFPVRNFFGAEISGTALVDAANLQKNHPLGARIFISRSAVQHLPQDKSFYVVQDKHGNLELLLQKSYGIVQDEYGKLEYLLQESNSQYAYECYFYLLSLCRQKPGRVFDHYVWSIASRAFMIGQIKFNQLAQKVATRYENSNITEIVNAVDEVLGWYRPVQRKPSSYR